MNKWLVIAMVGIRRAASSLWLRRMMFLAILPPIFFAVPFFLFEQAMRDPVLADQFLEFLSDMPGSEVLGDVIAVALDDPQPEQIDELRHRIWSYLLLTLFRYPQLIVMVLLVGIAAPPLISHDIRSRAFLIYFSKPISRYEYVLGKMGTVTFFLIMITTLPALVLYAAAVMLSPSTTILLATWDLPFRVLLASAVLILPTTSVALMFSSMTAESRFAGFAWFAVWILGNVMFNVVMAFTVGAIDGVTFAQPGWRTLLSPYHTLGAVQSWIFNLSTDEAAVAPAVALLTLVTVISLTVVLHRVARPMRV
jgi:ABC-type transport system involved in multi-copper enzyme maturation permease subunit